MSRTTIKNWAVEHAYRDLFFADPNLEHNEWLKYMYRNFGEMEDEGLRAPPLARLFTENITKTGEMPERNIVNLPRELDYRTRKENNGE
jgi:hypothetical protein